MRLNRLPVVQAIFESGPDDRVFDTLLLVGPWIIVLIALLGRSPLTTTIVLMYLGTFVGYSVSSGVQ